MNTFFSSARKHAPLLLLALCVFVLLVFVPWQVRELHNFSLNHKKPTPNEATVLALAMFWVLGSIRIAFLGIKEIREIRKESQEEPEELLVSGNIDLEYLANLYRLILESRSHQQVVKEVYKPAGALIVTETQTVETEKGPRTLRIKRKAFPNKADDELVLVERTVTINE